MTSLYYQNLVESTEARRQALLSHPIYGAVVHLESLRIFMEHHVIAVWDFMTLLKSLQLRLTCMNLPWIPVRDANAARIINEIVLIEESDEISPGIYRSHFETYLLAMGEAGASTTGINSVLTDGIEAANVPNACKQFVQTTFAAVEGPTHITAAAFLMGREDLIPQMFKRMTGQLPPNGHVNFKLYLDRHIEVDGGDHGPNARRLLESLCGNDPAKWNDARTVSLAALEARIHLWDAVMASITKHSRFRSGAKY